MLEDYSYLIASELNSVRCRPYLYRNSVENIFTAVYGFYSTALAHNRYKLALFDIQIKIIADNRLLAACLKTLANVLKFNQWHFPYLLIRRSYRGSAYPDYFPC